MAADTKTSSLESFFIGGIAGAGSSILPPGAEPRTADTGEDGGGCAQSIDDQASPSINAVTLDHHIFTAGMAASICSLTPVPAFENNHMPGGL